jgi:hypothetical protein
MRRSGLRYTEISYEGDPNKKKEKIATREERRRE